MQREPVRQVVSRSFALREQNIDTDQIIPARFLTVTERGSLGDACFRDWRFNADGSPKDHKLNRVDTQSHAILLAGDNFGCGSSREHAPWALWDFGVRAVITPRAGDIFKANAANNGLVVAEIDTAAHKRLVTTVETFTQTRPGLQAEEKPGSVALHFRNRPELQAECLTFMHEQRAGDSRLTLVEGKMVAELKFGTRDKRQAIADFMAEPPFQGRRPFFAGDDITDEAGFAGVNAAGGVSVKIGSGSSAARFRLADPAALAVWLAGLTADSP